MTEEIRRGVRWRRTRPPSAAFCDWLTELYELEMPHFIDRNYDSPLDLARPLRPGLAAAPARRLPPAGQRRAVATSTTSACSASSASSRCTPASPRTRRSPSTRSSPTWTPSTACSCPRAACTPCPSAWRRRPRRPARRSATAPGRADPAAPTARRARSRGVRLGGRRGRSRPTPWSATPTCPSPTARCSPASTAPRAARRGTYSPSCLVWHRRRAGPAARGRGPPQHPLRRGTGTAPSGRSSTTAVRMPDPSILVTVPSLDEPALAPAGCSSLYVLEPVPNLDGHVDWTASATASRDDLRRRVATLGYPTDVEVEQLRRPARLGARMGMERGTPFALAHRFAQTGPFRPANVDRRVPGLVFVGSGTVPGRRRADGARVGPAGRRARRPVRRRAAPMTLTLEESYARCRQLNKRYGTTYYWSHVRAAEGQAPPRVRALRVLPPRRRHRRRPRPGRRSTCGRRRWPTSATGSSPTSTAGAVRRPGAQGGRAHRAGLRHRPRLLPPVPALDGDGPHGHDLRDLGRPARGTWTARRR